MIYFLRHPGTGLIKIGLTSNLPGRLEGLRTRYGVLEPLGVVDGDYYAECWHHCCFRHANIRGILPGVEWFKPVDELLWYIEKYADIPVLLEPVLLQALEIYAHRRNLSVEDAMIEITREHLITTGFFHP